MKLRESRPLSQKLLIFGSILLWIGFLAALLFILNQSPEETTPPVFGSLDGRFESEITLELGEKTLRYRENEITNYLLIGVDTENISQVTNHQNGGQADFLVVLSIDRIKRCITPIMLDRDAMVEVQTYGIFGDPSGTRVMQLCLAQAYSGADFPGSENTVETVEKLLQGIKIHHYVVMDMAAIPLLNDTIGGVEVTLYDDFTVLDPAMTQGATLRLQGKQAEFFVRGRMVIGDGSNASRMARQQQYLSGLLTQFRRAVKGNQLKLNEVLSAVKGHMQSNAADGTLLQDVNAYDDYEWNALRLLSGKHAVDAYGFAEFWVDEADLKRLVADIWFK